MCPAAPSTTPPSSRTLYTCVPLCRSLLEQLLETYATAVQIHATLPFRRVADLAAGHGLLSWILLLLDRDGDDTVPMMQRWGDRDGDQEHTLEKKTNSNK